jgi:DNA-binding MarR family transcriptional regulator
LTVIRLAKVVEIVLARAGLTVNQYRMLTFIDEGAPALREMSTRLVMKAPNVTTLIDALVERGLVERGRHPEDGRRRELALTDEGRSLLDAANEHCERALRSLAQSVGGRHARLLAGLDTWVPALDDAAVRLAREELPGDAAVS